MTFQRLFLAACMCCILGVGTANAAPIYVAHAAYSRGDYAQALKLYRHLAAQGDAASQYNIGLMYTSGHGVTPNYQEGLKWYRLAAAQGHEGAIAELKFSADYYEEQYQRLNQPQQAQQPKQTKHSASNRIKAQEKASAPKLVFNSSTPRADGTVELSGRVTSSASISEVSINGRALEVPLAKDGSFKVVRRLPMGVTTYRLSVVDEFDQRADAEVNVERATIQYAEEVAPLDPRKMKARVNPNAVALIIGIEAYSRLPPAQYADSCVFC